MTDAGLTWMATCSKRVLCFSTGGVERLNTNTCKHLKTNAVVFLFVPRLVRSEAAINEPRAALKELFAIDRCINNKLTERLGLFSSPLFRLYSEKCCFSCQKDRQAAIHLLVTMHNDGEISLDVRRFKRLAKVELGMELM